MAIIFGTAWSDNNTFNGIPFIFRPALNGTVSADAMFGLSGNDILNGFGGNDFQDGGTGNDYLNGGTGNDYLNGGTGIDQLWGSAGSDGLVGGLDSDTFHFLLGDSNIATADTIWDWNAASDSIDMPIVGNAANYSEHVTADTSIAAVAAHANAFHTAFTYTFLFNSVTDTGYLVADLNNDNVFETGVELAGAGAAADLDWADIV